MAHDSSFKCYRLEEIQRLWRSRWDWFHHPLHAMAHILHPLWRSEQQYDDRELRDGWNAYVTQVYPDVYEQDKLLDELQIFRQETMEFSTGPARLREGKTSDLSLNFLINHELSQFLALFCGLDS